MNICGIICEYNPFHNGHKYLIDQIRKHQPDTKMVVCMSGNFVQRGEFAVYDKYARAKAAILNGIDLVIELPVHFSCCTAERFAFGGIYLLNALGCIDTLCFGSESGNIKDLALISSALSDQHTDSAVRQYLNDGMTYAAAREKAVKDTVGDIGDLMHNPNDILGIEYIKALNKLNSRITPCTFQRKGASHDSCQTKNSIASASYIRQLILSGDDTKNLYIPKNTVGIYSRPEHQEEQKIKTDFAMLYRLKTMNKKDFERLPDMSEGLENRLYKAVQNGNSVEEIINLAKCKRYTMSRIRRAVFHSFIGLTKNDLTDFPEYIKILDFNQNGTEILRLAKQTRTLPIVTRSSDIRKCPENAKQQFALEYRCDSLYNLISR